MVQYELIRENNNPLPFLIERDTGILTTIAVFHDKVGEMYEGRVRIYDNYGRAPSLENTCDIRVCDWLLYSVSNTYDGYFSGVCCQ